MVAGIVHASIAPVLVVGTVKPHLVLVAVVLVTAYAGFLPGITWAFVAGLTANLLVGDPLGAVPLAMLAVAALVAGGSGLFGPRSFVYPVLAAFGGSVVADAISLGVTQLVSAGAAIGRFPVDLVLGAAALNAVLTAVLVVPARHLATRYVADETPAW